MAAYSGEDIDEQTAKISMSFVSIHLMTKQLHKTYSQFLMTADDGHFMHINISRRKIKL